MAIYAGFDMKGFKKEIEKEPRHIKQVIKAFPPNKLYRIKSSEQRVTIENYRKDGTVTIELRMKFNAGLCPNLEGYQFNVEPEKLEECTLPPGYENSPGESWVDIT